GAAWPLGQRVEPDQHRSILAQELIAEPEDIKQADGRYREYGNHADAHFRLFLLSGPHRTEGAPGVAPPAGSRPRLPKHLDAVVVRIRDDDGLCPRDGNTPGLHELTVARAETAEGHPFCGAGPLARHADTPPVGAGARIPVSPVPAASPLPSLVARAERA